MSLCLYHVYDRSSKWDLVRIRRPSLPWTRCGLLTRREIFDRLSRRWSSIRCQLSIRCMLTLWWGRIRALVIQRIFHMGARLSSLACLPHPLSAPILAPQYWERNIGSCSTCTEYVDTFSYFGGSAFAGFPTSRHAQRMREYDRAYLESPSRAEGPN